MPKTSYGVVALCVLWTLAAACARIGDNPEDVGADAVMISVPTPSVLRLDPREFSLDDPLYQVGGTSATGPLAFGRVRGGVIGPQGRLWIADDLAGHIVVLDDQGGLSQLIGGKGQGPGEFMQVEVLGWGGGGIAAYDVEQRRTSVIDPVTAEVRTVSTRTTALGPDYVPEHVQGVGAQDRRVSIPLDQPSQPSGTGWTAYPATRVVVADHDGPSRTVMAGVSPIGTYFDGERYLRHPLQTLVDAAVSGDVAALVGTVTGDLLLADLDGTNVRSINWNAAPGLPVGPETRTWLESFWESLPAEQVRFFAPREAMTDDAIPDRRPFLDRVIMSSDGLIWVRRSAVGDGPRRWDVVTLDGTHVGGIELPEGESVLAADRHVVATLRRDPTDAHVVALYRNPLESN